jgi:hypothetical protein
VSDIEDVPLVLVTVFVLVPVEPVLVVEDELSVAFEVSSSPASAVSQPLNANAVAKASEKAVPKVESA